MKNNYAIFLDVDGVINSLQHLYTSGNLNFDAKTTPYQAGNYTIWVPDYMPELIQAIERSSDLYWLTTWRQAANEYISEQILGISSNIPVIDDGTARRAPDWKFNACRELAVQLSEDGKKVLWIEDFGRHYDTTLCGHLTYVDTDHNEDGVLLPQHLPTDFMEHLITNGNYNGPTYVAPPRANRKVDIYQRNFGVPTS